MTLSHLLTFLLAIAYLLWGNVYSDPLLVLYWVIFVWLRLQINFNKVLFLCFDSFYHLCSSSIVWSSWQSNSADAVIVPLDSPSWRSLPVRVLLSFYGSSCWAHLWRHWESPRNAKEKCQAMVKLLWFNCFFKNRNSWCNMIFRLIKILVKYLEFAKQ